MQALQAKPTFALKASTARVNRRNTVVCSAAQPQEAQSRRAALGVLAGLFAGMAVVESAQANAAAPKSSTAASMSGYTLEGTKKQGISPKRKAKLMAKARAEAEKASAAK